MILAVGLGLRASGRLSPTITNPKPYIPTASITTTQGNFKKILIPYLRPFWYYSLHKPPFRVRSGEVAFKYRRKGGRVAEDRAARAQRWGHQSQKERV